MKNFKLLLIKKYSKDFDILMKKAMETSKCTREECKELNEIFEKKRMKNWICLLLPLLLFSCQSNAQKKRKMYFNERIVAGFWNICKETMQR